MWRRATATRLAVEALFGAMDHSADLAGGREDVKDFTASLRKIVHKCMVEGKGTRDLCGPSGLTTEQFIDEVASQIGKDVSAATAAPRAARSRRARRPPSPGR